MANTTCSRCGETFHLRITSEEAINELKMKEINNEVLCLGCYKSLNELDVVQVIAINPNVPGAEIGDKGAVLSILNSNNGNKGYEVECVLQDGSNKWEGAFERQQLKWLQSANASST